MCGKMQQAGNSAVAFYDILRVANFSLSLTCFKYNTIHLNFMATSLKTSSWKVR